MFHFDNASTENVGGAIYDVVESLHHLMTALKGSLAT